MKIEEVYFDSIHQIISFYIGKNAKNNFEVIDLGNPDDIWFHLKDESSCHVVVRLPEDMKINKKDLMKIIKRGALLCKENTAKVASLKNVEVIYTAIKNVQKTSTPGMVNVDSFSTITLK